MNELNIYRSSDTHTDLEYMLIGSFFVVTPFFKFFFFCDFSLIFSASWAFRSETSAFCPFLELRFVHTVAVGLLHLHFCVYFLVISEYANVLKNFGWFRCPEMVLFVL